MINSVYTNKEIFLRELVSNASDALDKLYFVSLTDGEVQIAKDDLAIEIVRDKKNGLLRIRDNGIGMSAEELDANLGTIAKSGSKAFKDALGKDKGGDKKDEDAKIDIIGQFGVGFYSAFMVADKVTVLSRKWGQKPTIWSSTGLDGYSLSAVTAEHKELLDLVDDSNQATEKESDGTKAFAKPRQSGTEVILHLKKDDEDYAYSRLLDEYHLREIIKKHSDYIRYPIKMSTIKTVADESVGEGVDSKYKEVSTIDTINSRVPIWKRKKASVTEQEYNNFFADKFMEYDPPLSVVAKHLEGASEFDTVLFFPAKAPYNYHSKEYQKGLQLYASGVLISEKCEQLLPDYFGFVKGVVDSADLSLNLSRELLQQDRQVTAIADAVQKQIRNELVRLQKDEREKYEKFFAAFGLSLKYGAYEQFGKNKESLKDLLMFYSSTQKKLVSLTEYVSRMKEGQECVYFASGESVAQIDRLPSCELLKEQDYEILYLTDNIDEFVFKVLDEYNGKKFMASNDPKLSVGKDDQKTKTITDDNKDLLDTLKKELEGKVESVVISTRLKTHAVCLSTQGEVSLEMEKAFAQMPNMQSIKAQKVLEINAEHKLFETMQSKKQDADYMKKVANILYTTARLIEGLPIEDAVGFADDLCKMI
ncbi:MAG: molecular chaperone HtpG [Firmicutes bacterium]|nr:molecular chaperone HtpG [Bacillota bacterium]